MRPKVSLVIPALNEETGIEATIDQVPEDYFHEIIVVDGGSKDDTVARATARGAKVLIETTRGYGRAYKRGFEAATGEIIATADADATYPIEMVPNVVDYLLKKDLYFISCSRFPLADHKSMPVLNKYGNIGLSLAASMFYLHSFRDISSGMWVFRRSILETLDLATEGWCFSNEVKLEAYFRHPEKFQEFVVPYEERVGRTHNVTIWRTGVEVLGFMAMKRLEHFVRSRVADPRVERRMPSDDE